MSGISYAQCSATYESGKEVTLKATPCPGSYFAGWSGDGTCTGLNPTCTFIMDRNRNVVANFLPLPPSPGSPKNLQVTKLDLDDMNNYESYDQYLSCRKSNGGGDTKMQ